MLCLQLGEPTRAELDEILQWIGKQISDRKSPAEVSAVTLPPRFLLFSVPFCAHQLSACVGIFCAIAVPNWVGRESVL